jgi:LEA14-like dessication related protein
MKRYLLPIIYSFFLIALVSCAEIKPATIGGIENPKVNQLSTAGVDFTFDMRIKNPNNIGVTVYPASFDATVNGIDIGKIKLRSSISNRTSPKFP